jgi:hypothetical protein
MSTSNASILFLDYKKSNKTQNNQRYSLIKNRSKSLIKLRETQKQGNKGLA